MEAKLKVPRPSSLKKDKAAAIEFLKNKKKYLKSVCGWSL
jgi:hypothetical protein